MELPVVAVGVGWVVGWWFGSGGLGQEASLN